MVDLEPSVIDAVRKGTHRNLFHLDHLISGKEDTANNFARGRYTVGPTYLPVTLHAIPSNTESCHNLPGFFLFRCAGGGTGSDFGSLLLDDLTEIYKNKDLLEFVVFPDPRTSSVVVEPARSK